MSASKNILVLNAGSSSLKFTLFDMTDERMVAKGNVERIGLPGWKLDFTIDGKRIQEGGQETLDHKQALKTIFEHLTVQGGPLPDPQDLLAIGHRVVHGGEQFSNPARVSPDIKSAIRSLFPLAPLHNPPNYEGIAGADELLPGVPQVAVFDTAFHHTIPDYAYLYAIPYEFYERDGIRRYGFHGTSHRFVTLEAARILGRENDPDFRLITCHLGNGCSIAAVKGMKCIDTSMGLTPLEGLVMGTRSGDMDPAIIFHLIREKGMTPDEVEKMLNKKSGLMGLSGLDSGDMRDVLTAADRGDHRAVAAVEVFTYRIRKYIGAYKAALGGLDCVVFTAGIGENNPRIRQKICAGMELLGIDVDGARNTANAQLISKDDARVKVLVIHTNEELMIARDTLSVLNGN